MILNLVDFSTNLYFNLSPLFQSVLLLPCLLFFFFSSYCENNKRHAHKGTTKFVSMCQFGLEVCTLALAVLQGVQVKHTLVAEQEP